MILLGTSMLWGVMKGRDFKFFIWMQLHDVLTSLTFLFEQPLQMDAYIWLKVKMDRGCVAYSTTFLWSSHSLVSAEFGHCK